MQLSIPAACVVNLSDSSASTSSATQPISGSAHEASTLTLAQLLHQTPPPAREILRALDAAQRRHPLFLPNQPLVIAVSGGADSLCLLHALHQLAPIWHLSLHVAHLDHALRHDSADDGEFVASFAQQLALPFYTHRLTPGVLDDDAAGQEAAARSARYHFLRQVAEKISNQAGIPATIVTAHHQNDQAETLLLHLVQGSGLVGLAGMSWVGNLPDAHQPPVRLVRPFLAISRAAIHQYLHAYELQWREDASNQDPAHLRNRLRHEVLPLLATLNPNIGATLARTADLLSAEATHAASRDQHALAHITQTHTPSTRTLLDLFHLAQYDLATQRGVLRQTLLNLGIDVRVVGMEGIDALLEQAQKPTASGPHPLMAGWSWTILDSRLSLHRADQLPVHPTHPHLAAPLATPRPLPVTGTLTLDGWQLHSNMLAVTELPDDWRSNSGGWRLFCDAEQSGELYLTTFQTGMSIAPLGMSGHRRAVGDIFTDRKIASYLRPGWPVVVNGEGTIVWLCGLVVADSVRIQPTTRHVCQLQWQRETQATL